MTLSRAWAWSLLLATPTVSLGQVDYARDVLPILSNNCFACHGPDEKARKAKLRLDIKTDTPAIVPGKGGESEAVHENILH